MPLSTNVTSSQPKETVAGPKEKPGAIGIVYVCTSLAASIAFFPCSNSFSAEPTE